MSLKRKISHIANAFIRRGYWYNTILFPDCKKIWNYNVFNTDVINLGSTSALNAFNYEGLDIKAGNFALGHNPLCADFAMLKNYYSFLNPQGSTVIITLCPYSSLSGGYNYLEDRYYTLLYPSSMPVFYYRKQQEVKGIRTSPLSVYPLFGLFMDIKHLIIKNKTVISMNEAELERDAEIWYNSWLKEFSIEDFSAPLSLHNRDGIEDAASIINEMIKFCKERNIRPVMVIPPIYHSLAVKFTTKVRAVIIDSLLEQIEDKNVYYHNYMDDSDFTNDTSLFQNSFLMNSKGAKLFTRRVLFDIGLK